MNSELKRKACLPKTPSKQKLGNSDSLQVFCRLRPMMSIRDVSCISVISDSTIQLTRPGVTKDVQYSFKRIFSEKSTQKEIFDEVALPLVDQLIKGRNGLLFTYGVTGSGKTYTMTGVKQDYKLKSGIMPRCIDVLFNSLYDYQAKKFVFKPDKMNGFEVQLEEDAQRERDEYLRSTKFSKLRKKESNEDLTSARSKDDMRVVITEEDNAFAVFITYTEIYNNNVYDLLENFEENNICMKSQGKIIREDAARNMYVHGVTEVEVKSAEEAFEVLRRGQKRKKMASTNLNDESSRSHSIFTIRLVQAPLDLSGENVMQDKKVVGISQLSLVDLAGSERTNRTKNQGQRLREAGNINNSLMTLRSCLEILRENQQTAGVRMIPYREARLTHLFKKFFEGEGDIRMVVCVNPRKEDYDETVQIMRFAEVSQEITVKPTPLRNDLPVGLTPGRRRNNLEFKRAIQDLDKCKESSPTAYVPNDAGMIYNFDPFPVLENNDPLNGDVNKTLMLYLDERISKKNALREDLNSRVEKFRALILKQEKGYLKEKKDSESANARLESKNSEIKMLKDKIIAFDTLLNSSEKKCNLKETEIKMLHKKKKMLENRIIVLETALNSTENKCNLKETELEILPKKTKMLDNKIIALDTPLNSTENKCDLKETELEMLPKKMALSPMKNIPVSNPRYGNRNCNIHDKWIDHRPGIVAPMNTILQPVLKRRKSFTEVTSPKQVKKNSKYFLMTQRQETDGTIETQLYKGDVVPTAGGGAQVILNDVETLKQGSPLSPQK